MRRLLAIAPALFLAVQPVAAAPDWGTATEVEVRLASFSFTPAKIELVAGRPYLLRLINTGRGGHNFHAKQFFAAAQVAAADQSKIRKGAVELASDATLELRLVAPAAGTYPLDCSHFLHEGFGMTGEIVVSAP
jgi:uncharacterized cupredoxin-like copper-binding protein